MKLLLKLFFLLLILAIAGVFGAVRYLESWAQSPLALKEPVVLTVQKGASFYAVARQLETMALIEDARLLRWYLRIKRENRLLQVGEYQLQPGITLQQLLDK
ncbi:MAG: endolytic transglycosylase MltG, partial [Pseudomonadales bacterium]|nr:endolytic transglycosylase MltG [Pseudomonadales bacterium]